MKSGILLSRILAFSIAAQAFTAWGASPWVPEPGKLSITTFYVYDTFQDYRPGAVRGRLPEPYKQYTGYTFFEYGLRHNLAIDLESGYTSTDFRGSGLGGIVDTSIGARWQVKQGESYVVTVRGAAIIKGGYDITRAANFSPGDKASGVLGSVMLGNNWKHNMFTFVETGYRVRQNPVPQDFFGTAGVGKGWRYFTTSTSYQTSRSINGVDIVGAAPKWSPYFNPTLFPATKKIFGAMDFNATVRMKSGINFGFNYSKILHGRNVGIKDVFAVSFGFNLPGKGPYIR